MKTQYRRKAKDNIEKGYAFLLFIVIAAIISIVVATLGSIIVGG